MLNKLSVQEKKLLSYVGLFLVSLLVLWVFFAPDRGLLSLYKTKKEIQSLQAENSKLAEKNRELQAEIDRLHNDPEYLEEKARKEYGMLKENEVLYIFKKK